jgi:hypothetical protein
MIKGKVLGASKSPKSPRISVNKLAEYLDANPSRRKAIVTESKYPEPFIVTRYKDAREFAKLYFASSMDEDAVLKEIKRFEKLSIAAAKLPGGDFQAQDNQLSADALTLLLESELPDFSGAIVSPYADQNKKIITKGVAISINPDLVVKKNIAGIVNVGIIKLHFIKNFQLSDESQKIVSVMLHEYAKKHVINVAKGEVVNSKFCISFDIFKQQFVVCPTGIKLRLRRVEDACEEIALWWDKL